jgi:hypothetical protein
MGAKPKRGFKLETEWMHGYAETYLPNESGFWFSDEALREEEVDLIDVRHALRVGVVIESEKLDEPGALWTVVSSDCDGRLLLLMVKVITDTIAVSLESIKRYEQRIEDEEHDVA